MSRPLLYFMVWFIVGVVFIVLELMIPTNFILLCFGLGMIGAGLTALIHAPFWLQLLVGSGVTAVSLWFMHRHFARPDETGGAFGSVGMVGKSGYVMQAIDPLKGGVVRVNGEDWRAVTRGVAAIPERTRVRVIDIEGTKLVVEPIEEPREPSGSV